MNDDDLFRQRLRRAAGPPALGESALDALRPHMVRARRRRRSVVASGVGAALLALGGSAWALSGRDQRAAQVDVVSPPPSSVESSPTTTRAALTSTTTAVTATIANSTTTTSTTSRPPPAVTTGAPAPTATTIAVPQTKTYTSSGGSIAVRIAGDTLSLASVTPLAGWQSEVKKNTLTEVEVEFRRDSPSGQARIRVRVEGERVIEELD